MRNYTAAECRKATRDNLRNVPHLIFRKLPLDNFPHSAVRSPQNTHAPRQTLLWKSASGMWPVRQNIVLIHQYVSDSDAAHLTGRVAACVPVLDMHTSTFLFPKKQ